MYIWEKTYTVWYCLWLQAFIGDLETYPPRVRGNDSHWMCLAVMAPFLGAACHTADSSLSGV